MTGVPPRDERSIDPTRSRWVRYGGALLTLMLVSEVVLRVFVYWHFIAGNRVMTLMDREVNSTWHDVTMGRTSVAPRPDGFYFSPETTFSTALAVKSRVVAEYSVRTNSLGYLSDREYRIERDPQTPEFRIVVLGDSMTGRTLGTGQWVDSLEDTLNRSAELRAVVGDRSFRTYNLGIPGAGFQRFAQVLREKGLSFDPDIVIVNFIEDDFARTLDGIHVAGHDTSLTTGVAAARDILALSSRVIFLAMPTYRQLGGVEMPLTQGLTQAMAPAPVIDMRTFMPRDTEAELARSWYNLPWDQHVSDQGGDIYARGVAAALARHIGGRQIDFAAPPPSRTVPVRLKIAENPDGLARLRQAVDSVYARTRTLDLSSSFLWLMIRGRSTEVFWRPMYRPLEYSLIEVRYGASEDDRAWLAVACDHPPPALDNPACWQWNVFYVRD